MSYEIRANYEQLMLLSPSIEEWIPKEHPARFVRDFVDSLNMTELGFKVAEVEEGRPPYAVDLLLKVWLYGYFHKIRSLRGLEQAVYNHVGLLWLTGMNYPDHNTLWRFWRDNRKALHETFKQVVLIAKKAGLIGMVLQALDGTKIAAQVSRWNGWHYSDLKKELEAINVSIEEVMKQVERSASDENRSYQLPASMRDAHRRKEEIQEAMKELDIIKRDHLHPKDKEARMMKSRNGETFCYNAQAVVDNKHNLIVAEDVVNDENDSSELMPMIDKAVENCGKRSEDTVADAGYYSGEQFAKAEEKEVNITVNIPENVMPQKDKKEFHKTRFSYNKEKDVFVCPLGKTLTFERARKNRQGKSELRIYKCQSYRECARRFECSKEKRGRIIEKGLYYEAVLRQIEKHRKVETQDKLKRRMTLAEGPFAAIKEHLGFKRFTVKGLENVRIQWALMCTIFDLRKIYPLWLKGTFSFTS